MKQVLKDIQTGEYAKSFIIENRAGAPTCSRAVA
jgi:ketol-acid reductoisomerase